MRLFKSLLLTLLVLGMLNSCKKDEPTPSPNGTAVLPEVITKPATKVFMTGAVCGGEIISNGGSDILARGVCYSAQPNPRISDMTTSDGDSLGIYESEIEGLEWGTQYFFRAYATNDKGTAYGDLDSFTTKDLGVGYSMQGGVVTYIFTEDDRGFHKDSISGIISSDEFADIATPTEYAWGCQGNEEVGNTSEEIGYGASNTKTFINGCFEDNTAALFCYNYSFKGYDDWFLPSIKELEEIDKSWGGLGFFGIKSVWSSSQATDSKNQAWAISDDNSGDANLKRVEGNKEVKLSVIPARYFSVPKR